MILTREQILAAKDRPSREVPVPAWGGSVIVRALNGRDRYEVSEVADSMKVSVASVMLVRAIQNEAGERIFTDEDAGEIEEKSGNAIGALMVALNELSAIGAEGLLAEKKPSEPTLSESSSSASPES